MKTRPSITVALITIIAALLMPAPAIGAPPKKVVADALPSSSPLLERAAELRACGANTWRGGVFAIQQ